MSRAARTVRVPGGWTPATAASVVGLLEQLADAVWESYGNAIWAWRDQQREEAGAQDTDEQNNGDTDGPDAWAPKGCD